MTTIIFSKPLAICMKLCYHVNMEVKKIKNIGFPIDNDLYVKLKIECLKENVSLKEFLTQLIKKEIEKREENEQKK